MKKQIVLASSSPFRRELLEKLGLNFICDSPDIDETARPNETPQQLVARLAQEKANAVAARHPNALIIASDQCAILDDNILGKPGDHQTAVKQLQAASGKKVLFLTSLVLLNSSTNKAQAEVCPFSVYFRSLTTSEIKGYLNHEQPYNCAGSFKSEGLGISLFQRLEGDDPNTLIGLQLIRLTAKLGKEGVSLY